MSVEEVESDTSSESDTDSEKDDPPKKRSRKDTADSEEEIVFNTPPSKSTPPHKSMDSADSDIEIDTPPRDTTPPPEKTPPPVSVDGSSEDEQEAGDVTPDTQSILGEGEEGDEVQDEVQDEEEELLVSETYRVTYVAGVNLTIFSQIATPPPKSPCSDEADDEEEDEDIEVALLKHAALVKAALDGTTDDVGVAENVGRTH